MKITVIMGTRPEIIKMAPIVLEGRRRGLAMTTVFTGQHLGMANPILATFGIQPEVTLHLGGPAAGVAGVAADILNGLEANRATLQADWILVQGDTTSALMGAYWGFLNKLPVAHVEAGLRTHRTDEPFPEETNRQMISRLAALHFPPTQAALDNLQKENVSTGRSHIVGNTGIDALLYARELVLKKRSADKIRDFVSNRKVIFITAHRRENLGDRFVQICRAVKEIAETRENVCFVFPVHLNPLVRSAAHQLLGKIPNVLLCEPLDYLECVDALLMSDLILTDSGGLQEEAPALGIPLLVLRDSTERVEGVTAGVATLVGTNAADIVTHVTQLLNHPKPNRAIISPYGDGQASARILDVLILGTCQPFQADQSNLVLAA